MAGRINHQNVVHLGRHNSHRNTHDQTASNNLKYSSYTYNVNENETVQTSENNNDINNDNNSNNNYSPTTILDNAVTEEAADNQQIFINQSNNIHILAKYGQTVSLPCIIYKQKHLDLSNVHAIWHRLYERLAYNKKK